MFDCLVCKDRQEQIAFLRGQVSALMALNDDLIRSASGTKRVAPPSAQPNAGSAGMFSHVDEADEGAIL